MPYDGIITSFLGQGVAADRPVTPNLHPDAIGLYSSTDTGALSVWSDSAWADYYSAEQVDAAIASIVGSGEGAPLNGIVSGCGVAYTGSLGFAMSAGSAYIDGDLVTATAQTVTLDAADATHPRIDVLYLNSSGTFGKVTGTPAASPSQPSLDPTTQLYLTFVLVPATATDLDTGITTETIYDEGSEWTGTTSGSGFTVDSTNNPNAGTKCIEGTAVASGAYVKFVDGSPTSFDGDGNLLISVRSKASWNTKRVLNVQWYASGVAVGIPVGIKQGSFGFASSNTSTYQLLVIGKSLFSVPAGTTVDELRITAAGSGGAAIGFYIDPIKLQNTGDTTGGGTVSGITQEQADARYLKLTGGELSGDLVVPDDAYGAGWNGSREVATKNAIYDKIEAVVAGGGYTDEQAQDAVGGILTDTGLAVVTYTDATPEINVNVPAAAASDINTGTDTTKALTADALAGSNFGKAVVTILVSDPAGSAITTGDGKAYYRVPSTLNGMNLVSVAGALTTVSSSGIPTVQIANVTQAADMLTTKLTIDANETDSSTAAAAAVIDTGNDDVATGDMLRIDIDVAGTGAKGLMVEMQFQLP